MRIQREHFGKHLRSIAKCSPGLPVAEHFSSNGRTAADALVLAGSKSVMGTCNRIRKCVLSSDSGHASNAGDNFDFHFIRGLRAHAKCNFQILKLIPDIVAQLVANIPLTNGAGPKRLGIWYKIVTCINTNVCHQFLLHQMPRSLRSFLASYHHMTSSYAFVTIVPSLYCCVQQHLFCRLKFRDIYLSIFIKHQTLHKKINNKAREHAM